MQHSITDSQDNSLYSFNTESFSGHFEKKLDKVRLFRPSEKDLMTTHTNSPGKDLMTTHTSPPEKDLMTSPPEKKRPPILVPTSYLILTLRLESFSSASNLSKKIALKAVVKQKISPVYSTADNASKSSIDLDNPRVSACVSKLQSVFYVLIEVFRDKPYKAQYRYVRIFQDYDAR
ncbi:hypothetical protein CEXT_741601 [Caerostris extrusa]|uniref:Uncharacterized protein n=1 Tax=Caerostris extrusa TaxID=172846 RepID=A0AAV4Q6A6_CAEEX|nr:hypothetical protein CEXT_741601 [Caerostris extrusa]